MYKDGFAADGLTDEDDVREDGADYDEVLKTLEEINAELDRAEAGVIECENVLDQRRCERLKRLCPELSDKMRRWYSNYYEIIARLTDFKMTDEEMHMVSDHLCDVLIGLVPQICAVEVDAADAGRLLLALMGLMPAAAELTREEKRWFAFCVCLRTYDDILGDEDGTRPGITRFTSVDDVKAIRAAMEKEGGPVFFEHADNPPAYDAREPFGFSRMNPIMTVTIPASYDYLKRLISVEGPYTLERNRSLRGAFGEILDEWEVTVECADRKFKKYTLYINPYGLENSTEAPEGFILTDDLTDDGDETA